MPVESSKMVKKLLEDMVRVCHEIHCYDKEKLECLVSLLRSDATRWWESVTLIMPKEEKTYDATRWWESITLIMPKEEKTYELL